ncbi:DMT family transporter [Oribacterium sp. P6A1]|uniref:DMT family transporter n=1 Tax=Oribacterium sp. P6A1 TaxID=1410612 RepID=UPI00055D4E39|nr:DMT family transporter [Oribacterium sp. P6A1]
MEKKKSKAILYICSSAFFFNLMNIFVRLSGDVPSIQKSFFRNLVAVFVALFMLLKSGEGFHPQKKNLPVLLGRSFFGTIGILCNFYAVDHLPLANASILNKMAPFMVLIFSYFILKEKLKSVHIFIILLAFAGCLFVVKPSPDNINLIGSVSGLMGGITAGLAYTLVRLAGLRGEKGATIVLFFSAFSCLSVLPYIALNFHPMTLHQLSMLLLAGASATAAQFSVTAAYSHAPSKEISVYDYTQVLWAAAFGFLLFGDIPDVFSVVGYCLIIGAAIVMYMYNQRH